MGIQTWDDFLMAIQPPSTYRDLAKQRRATIGCKTAVSAVNLSGTLEVLLADHQQQAKLTWNLQALQGRRTGYTRAKHSD
jgi:hypothetical protein